MERLRKLRDEILTQYPHGETLEMREVGSRYFIEWHVLTYSKKETFDLQTALDDFEGFVLNGF